MATTPPELQPTPSQIGAALLIGSIGLLMLGLQPILLGDLVERHLISMEGVGLVAMGEIIALGLGAAGSETLMPLVHHRRITMLAALAVGVLDLLTCLVSGDLPFTSLRAVAGVAEGVLVWSATSVIVRTGTPDRIAALFILVQTLTQVALAALLAGWVVPQFGWRGGFRVLGGLTLVVLLLARELPSRIAPLVSAATPALRWRLANVLPLLVAFSQMAAVGALWAYLEPLGMLFGLDAQGAQTTVSVVLATQVLGGIAAVWCVRSFALVWTLSLGSVALAAVAAGMFGLAGGLVITFGVLCAVLGFVWLFSMPFHIALAFRVDAKGRVAMLVPAAQLLGAAIGPLVASFTVSGDETGPVPLVSLGFAMAALALTLIGAPHWGRVK